MFSRISGLAVALWVAGASAEAGCYYSTGFFGHTYIQASDSQYVAIRVEQTDGNLKLLEAVCNETFRAVQCIEHTRYTGESVRLDSDLGPDTYVNYGPNFATLEIEKGSIASWIAQFVPSYAGKTYASVAACESHRAEAAILATANAQNAIESRHNYQNDSDYNELRNQGRKPGPGKI
jgi:hypothetical protein